MTQGIEHVEPPLDSGRVQILMVVLASIALICAISLVPETPPPADSLSHMQVSIDVNTASPRELSLLPGVGPVLAERIVENRERLGHFAATEEIGRVYGVGRKTIEQIQSYATVKPAEIQRDRRVASATSDEDSFDLPSR